MEVEVLFSSRGILALNKPPGMCSQGPKNSPIPELWELMRLSYPRGHIAHRIDQYTSGINLFGETPCQIGYLMGNWHQITRKTYLAIVNNPTWDETMVSTPIDGKTAVTRFTVLERSGIFALVQCELIQNGRTHQIRRHLKSIGYPIVGDRKYGGMTTEAREGQLLHAWKIEVRLPDDNARPRPEWTTIQAPIPDDFKQYKFNWSRWDKGSTVPLSTIEVPQNWTR